MATASGSRATATPWPPSAVGPPVDVSADLKTVTITCDGRQVGSHSRCWAAQQTITDSAHAAVAQQLHHQHLTQGKRATPAAGEDVERRQLSDYDTAFGLDEPIETPANDLEAVV